MNGKQAKLLRRQAEAMTVGWDAVGYELQYVQATKGTTSMSTRLLSASTRAAYRNLKRRHNAARRIGR